MQTRWSLGATGWMQALSLGADSGVHDEGWVVRKTDTGKEGEAGQTGLELKRGCWWSPRDHAEPGAWFLSSAFRDRHWWLGLVQWRELGQARTVLLRGCYMSAFVKYQSTHMFDVCRIKGDDATRAMISLPVSLDAPLKRTLHLQICPWKSSLCLSSGEMQRY